MPPQPNAWQTNAELREATQRAVADCETCEQLNQELLYKLRELAKNVPTEEEMFAIAALLFAGGNPESNIAANLKRFPISKELIDTFGNKLDELHRLVNLERMREIL